MSCPTVELYRRHFRLEGERVIRISTGRDMLESKPNPRGYLVANICGKVHLVHRIKFALQHGYLPKEVDHRDRNEGNSALSNLRPSSRGPNLHNRQMKYRGLPRCVYRTKGGRYVAKVSNRYLGTRDTPEGASELAEACLKSLYGDDYTEIE